MRLHLVAQSLKWVELGASLLFPIKNRHLEFNNSKMARGYSWIMALLLHYWV